MTSQKSHTLSLRSFLIVENYWRVTGLVFNVSDSIILSESKKIKKRLICVFLSATKFGTSVSSVNPVYVKDGWNGLAWNVTTNDGLDHSKSTTERFDAVMVCNG